MKLSQQVVGRGAALSLSQLVTQLPQGKPVRMTQERFVMVLTDCDSLFFTAVHWWGDSRGGGGPCLKESSVGDSVPETDFGLLFRGKIKEAPVDKRLLRRGGLGE